MLKQIEIKNFALIDTLNLELSAGLNIFTGETGAGKSIVIEALSFVLGARGDSGLIKQGANKMEVSAIFEDVSWPKNIKQKYNLKDKVKIYRSLDTHGKNTVKIDGKNYSVQTLNEIGNSLIDFHGQHEHQKLFNSAEHLTLLDTFAKNEKLLKETAAAYQEYQDIKAKADAAKMSEEEKAKMLDLYSYQLKEIQNANLKQGEEEEINEKLPALKFAGRLKESAKDLCSLLDDEGAACERLNKASQILEDMAQTDKNLEDLSKELNQTANSVREITSAVVEYANKLDVDPQVLDNLLSRQEEIKKIKQKYGPTFEDVFSKEKELQEKLNALQNSEENIQLLNKALEKQAQKLISFSEGLRNARQKAASILSKQVVKEIKPLGFSEVRFEAALEPLDFPGPKGFDKAEFLFSANAGQSLRPLRNIASGGEISRLMLGLKMLLAGEVQTMVFDEVDTGISGTTATLVGERLAKIAKNRQVLCVTHLAQVAAYAGKHFKVEKSIKDSKTIIKVSALENKNKALEIARMIGSTSANSAGFEHACELLKEAQNV